MGLVSKPYRPNRDGEHVWAGNPGSTSTHRSKTRRPGHAYPDLCRVQILARSHRPTGKPEQTRCIAHNMGYIRQQPAREPVGVVMQTRIKRHRVGEVSSKYGYNPEQFDKDLEARKARSDALWADFLGWVKAHGLTPEDARGLLLRLREEYLNV